MNFDAYARTAVDLVNAQLSDLAGLQALFCDDQTWMRDEVVEKDLAVFRRARRRLREVFEYGTSGRDADAVRELNALLETFPVQPRISGHEAGDWHMHVTSRGSSVSAEYLAGAVWGLSVWLCEYGSARFGICADERCGNVYLDTSSNNCRRFCSERCATRSHVAAHRARKRAGLAGAELARDSLAGAGSLREAVAADLASGAGDGRGGGLRRGEVPAGELERLP